MAYFQTKSGSLEESIRKAVSGKIEEQNYKPVKANHYDVKVTVKDRDVAKVKKIISNFKGDIEDVDSDQVDGGGNKFKGTGDIFIQGDDAGKLGLEIAKSVRTVKVMGETNKNDKSDDGEGLDAVQPKAVKKKFDNRKDKDIDNDGDTDDSDEYIHKKRKAISKAMSKENYELGTPENTKSKLDATPGQSSAEWEEQVNTMQNKNNYMRETLAKMWGMKEGHNPFDDKKEEKKSKKEDKTMTGKPTTKVEIDPDMKEVSLGKKNVR